MAGVVLEKIFPFDSLVWSTLTLPVTFFFVGVVPGLLSVYLLVY